MIKEDKIRLLNKAFSPSAPIKEKDFFHGRITQLTDIMDAINESGQHAILYGERGVGKTSLANIMASVYTNLFPVKVTCSRDSNFKSLWQETFSKIQFSQKTNGLGFKAEQKETILSLGNQISEIENVTPSTIIEFLGTLASSKFLFIFDEFDNITDLKTRTSFADLIKSLSDNVENTTIVLVGIADNVESLIGSHHSLERCLKQVRMPRMSSKESVEIITNGLNMLQITISDSIRNQIVDFSSGFPHYIHLLCKYGAKELIENNKTEFSSSYLKIAIKNGIENTSEQLRNSYQKAINDPMNNSKWINVLHACATAHSDQFNCFTCGDVSKQYNSLRTTKVLSNNIIYNLNQFCKKERGEVLRKIGKGVNTRFIFINPMMRAYVKLKISTN